MVLLWQTDICKEIGQLLNVFVGKRTSLQTKPDCLNLIIFIRMITKAFALKSSHETLIYIFHVYLYFNEHTCYNVLTYAVTHTFFNFLKNCWITKRLLMEDPTSWTVFDWTHPVGLQTHMAFTRLAWQLVTRIERAEICAWTWPSELCC